MSTFRPYGTGMPLPLVTINISSLTGLFKCSPDSLDSLRLFRLSRFLEQISKIPRLDQRARSFVH
jgi:hypothetical protein